MDSQGFTANGHTVKNGVKTAAGYVQPGAAGLMPANKARIAMNDVVGVAHASTIQDSDERHIAGLRKVQHRSDLFMGEFFGMMGGGALAWGARLINKSQAATVIHAIFTAPFEAMRATTLDNLADFPSQYMRMVAKHADEAALKAAHKSIRSANKTKLSASEIDALIAKTDFKTFDYASVKGAGSKKWVASATEKATALEASGKEFSANVGEALEPITGSVRGVVRSGLESIETTGFGKSIQSGMQKVVDWRVQSKSAHYTKHLDKAHEALTKEVPGFWANITNFFTGKKAADLGSHGALTEVTSHLNKARSATTGAERVLHTDAAANALQKLSATADKGLKLRVDVLKETIQKSGSAAKALNGLEGASGKGLTEIVKVLSKGAGRLPLFGTILGVSAVAGVSATLLTHRHENKISKKSRSEIVDAIGENSPLAQRMEQAHASEYTKHIAKTSFEVVGDVANAAMGMVHGGGGAAMMGAVMLPMVGTMLIKDNALLNAYANLRQEEKTGKPLQPQDKAEFVRQLVANVPSVEAHGGYYNRLTAPVAEAIVDKNLTAIQVIKLLANEQQFTALALEVQQKQKALATPAAPTATAVAGANDNHAVVNPQVPVPHLAAGTAISANSIQHDGRVDALQKTAGI